MSVEILSATAAARFLGRCDTCDRPIAVVIEHTGDHAQIACPDCGKHATGQRLYGTETAAHCNAACEGAIGPTCECACSGVNHGGVWVESGEMLADQLAAYRTKRANREAAAAKRRTARRAARQDSFTLWASTNAAVIDWLAVASNVDWSDFLVDMADKVEAGEELSDNMVAAVERAMTRQVERDARLAEEAATAGPVIAGKAIQVEGEIVNVAVEDNPFGYGNRVTMIVRDDRGFKVRGTIPGALRDEVSLNDLTGRRARFTADVETSDRDDTFGFFKRPRRAEITDELAAESDPTTEVA